MEEGKKFKGPLTVASKIDIICKIKQFDDEKLLEVLQLAVCEGYPFPNDFECLPELQQAYQKSDKNQALKKILVSAIEVCLKPNGINQFKALDLDEKNAGNWKSSLLIFMASELGIKIPQQDIVEGQIQNGKVYWRILDETGNEIYSRPEVKNQAFEFNAESAWRMSIEQFKTFKNSGKRSGSLEITSNRFIDRFEDDWNEWAANLWIQLEENRIITPKNHLSQGFRYLSNVVLDMDCELLGQVDISEEVVKQIYMILDNEGNKEIISSNGRVLFEKWRPERSRKEAKGTGRVINLEPTSVSYSTQLWDVGIHSDLTAHYNSQHVDMALECDHITSSALLKDKKNPYIRKLIAQRSTSEDQLKVLKTDLNKKVKYYSEKSGERYTRAEEKSIITNHFNDEKKAIDKEASELKQYNTQIELLRSDKSSMWWTIAIPESLHQQGLTYQKKLAQQKKNIKVPFYDEVKYYLKLLETRAEDFQLTDTDYIVALGAFRTLFRCQLKKPEAVCAYHTTGITPYLLFNSEKSTDTIDQLFNESVQSFIFKHEGV